MNYTYTSMILPEPRHTSQVTDMLYIAGGVTFFKLEANVLQTVHMENVLYPLKRRRRKKKDYEPI